MRNLLNSIRATRDRIRQRYSRWRYDRKKPIVDTIARPRRILFIRWDAKWGDSVVFSFVPQELQRHGISVEVATTAEMAPVFRDEFAVDAVHEIKKRPGYSQIRRLAQRIGEVDLVVFFSKSASHRAIYLLSQLQARHIASLDDSVGLVDLKLGAATRGQHFTEKYLTLLGRCGVEATGAQYIVPRNEPSEQRVENFLKERAPFICFNAYSKGRARTLTPDTIRRLIKQVLEELPEHEVCVLSAPGKQQEVIALCDELGERVFCFPDTQTIYDNIALIARADALVSGITATVHMADGLDVPSFVLFPHDPIDRDDWHSRHPQSINLLAELGEPLDVNRLNWNEVEGELSRFIAGLR